MTAKRKPKPMTATKRRFQCAACHTIFPSPEAGDRHIEQRHDGYGILLWV